MTANRLDEIRAREKSMRERAFLPEDNEIRYLLQLLDARPAVAGDARFMVHGPTSIVSCNDSRCPVGATIEGWPHSFDAPDCIYHPTTITHANQRYREGLYAAIEIIANEKVDADSSKDESDYAYNRALEDSIDSIRAALLQKSE